MQASVLHVEFGHPEFWKTVHDACPRFFEVRPRLKTSFYSIAANPRTFEDRNRKTIFNLCLLAGVAMEELVTLAGNGLGIGAMKIARNLLELSINAEYLRMNPAAVSDFVDWFWVEQNRLLTYAQQHDPDLLKQFTPDAIAHTQKEFARVRSTFVNTKTGKLRQGWCAVDLANRAIQTHLEVPYRLVNPFGSQFLHGTVGAVLNHFDLAASQEQIAPPPSLKWCPQALCGGHHCLAAVIHTLETMLGQEANPCCDEIVKDFQYAWPAASVASLYAQP